MAKTADAQLAVQADDDAAAGAARVARPHRGIAGCARSCCSPNAARSDARRPMQLAARGPGGEPAAGAAGPGRELPVHRPAHRPRRLAAGAGAARRRRQARRRPAAGGLGVARQRRAALPLTVSLVADEVRVARPQPEQGRAGRVPHRQPQWLANVSAREINGFLTWSESAGTAGKLTARLGRLEIPQSQQQEIATSLSTGPTSLPAMDITARAVHPRRLRFRRAGARRAQRDRARSRATAAARAAPSAAAGLAAGAPAPDHAGGANCRRAGSGTRNTSLTYRLDISDAGGFLNRLQLKDVVKGGNGSLSGELHWSGSPFSMDLPSLGGTMDIAIRDGQFLKVEPGAAKLIGVLNLQALPKLLTLDFRDIFAQGFSFDELRGNVDHPRRRRQHRQPGDARTAGGGPDQGPGRPQGQHPGPQGGGGAGTQRRPRDAGLRGHRQPGRSGWARSSRSRCSASRCRGRWPTRSTSPAPGRIRRWWSASASASGPPVGQ